MNMLTHPFSQKPVPEELITIIPKAIINLTIQIKYLRILGFQGFRARDCFVRRVLISYEDGGLYGFVNTFMWNADLIMLNVGDIS